jgi:hypothetical protein
MPQLERSPEDQITRRGLLKAGAGVAGAAVLGGAALAAAELTGSSRRLPRIPAHPVRPAHKDAWSFRSEPDLRPAVVTTEVGDAGSTLPLFLGPKSLGGSQSGALLVDNHGNPVYFHPAPQASDLVATVKPWSYRGERVLAWWQGQVVQPGYGRGHALVLDSAYRMRVEIRALRGRDMDLHALHLTPEATALFTCYPQLVAMDLSSIGGPRNGQVMESVFQEIDVATGRLLLEWHSLQHISVEESYRPVAEPYDYLHLNSIDVAPDGNLLVSGRHTWALYKLDRRTGEVIWRLGGKRSDFDLGPGVRFAWQHDGAWPSRDRLTVFDDGSDGPTVTEKRSRGLVLALDEPARRVSLEHAYIHPDQRLLAVAMGSVQILPGGDVVVGWGTAPYTSQFTHDGRLVEDWVMPPTQLSYRAYRLPWQGRPHQHPAVAARRAPDGSATLYVSWNGSTETQRWLVESAHGSAGRRVIGVAPRRGFETVIRLGRGSGRVTVTALDAAGRRLASSRTVRV